MPNGRIIHQTFKKQTLCPKIHPLLFPFVNFMSKISDIMHVYLKYFELPELNNSKYYRKFPFLLNPNYQRAEIMRFFLGYNL